MPPYSKQFVAVMCSFKLKMYQTRFRPGSAPDPDGGAYGVRRSPRPPNRLGRGSLPILLPFDAFAVFDLPEGLAGFNPATG